MVGLSHPSSGELVKVLLPPDGSSQETKHMREHVHVFLLQVYIEPHVTVGSFFKITSVKRFLHKT